MEHLVVIIDNKGVVPPKLYSCKLTEKTKDDAVKSAKKAYETKTKNFDYEAYHFTH